MARHRLHTVRPRRRLACGAVLALLAASASAGCDAQRESAALEPPPMLATQLRLVEDGMPPQNDKRLERGAWKIIDGTAHPTLTGARAFAPAVSCAPVAKEKLHSARRCTVTVPRTLPDAPQSIFSWYADSKTRAKGEPAPERKLKSRLLRSSQSRTVIGRLRSFEAMGARIYQVPPLTERALESEPLVVPPRAVLRLSFGVEEPAWRIDSAPVYFRVAVENEDGLSQDLLRRILDPARTPTERRWFDADVDLTDLVGKTVRLRFTTEPAEAGDVRPSLPVWGDPRILTTEPKSEDRRPSIVLVSLDTLRAKSIGAYGYELDTTPSMDAFAREGALFENAFTTFSNTLSSHMSMLTGLYPARHGVMVPGSELGPEHPTLAELLRAAGYATAAFTEDALLDARRGFRRGFSTYFENTEIGVGAGDAAGTFGRALEWAGRHADERLFLFVHTYEVHAPYDPPPAYRELFKDAAGKRPSSASKLAYEQEARRLDDELRRLLEGLRLAIPERELLVVLTADHGEEFGEHGLVGHLQIYDEVMHIPLILVWPGRIPAERRIPNPVSLVDLVPTVLQLASVPAPAGLDGVSLVPLLDGTSAALERDIVFAEHPPMAYHPRRRFAARSATAKCLLDEGSGGRDVCFDLVQDPDEAEPRDPNGRVEFVRLHEAGSAYRARSVETFERLKRELAGGLGRSHAAPEHDVATPTPAPGEAAPPPPDERIERKLRALGYAE